MALILRRRLSTGGYVEYHRIVQTNIDWRVSACRLAVASYTSESARESGFDPVCITELWFEGAEPELRPPFPFKADGGTREEAYAVLKTLPEYQDAKDA